MANGSIPKEFRTSHDTSLDHERLLDVADNNIPRGITDGLVMVREQLGELTSVGKRKRTPSQRDTLQLLNNRRDALERLARACIEKGISLEYVTLGIEPYEQGSQSLPADILHDLEHVNRLYLPQINDLIRRIQRLEGRVDSFRARNDEGQYAGTLNERTDKPAIAGYVGVAATSMPPEIANGMEAIEERLTELRDGETDENAIRQHMDATDLSLWPEYVALKNRKQALDRLVRAMVAVGGVMENDGSYGDEAGRIFFELENMGDHRGIRFADTAQIDGFAAQLEHQARQRQAALERNRRKAS